MSSKPPRSRRGFAAMSPERRRQISAKGGKAVPADKRTFSKDRAKASEAGVKGTDIQREMRERDGEEQ